MPLNEIIEPSDNRIFEINISIQTDAGGESFTVSINSPLDVDIIRLDDTRALIESAAEPYPYRSGIISIAEDNTEESFMSYPNPFRPGAENANIRFYLSSAAGVNLDIYDLIGRKVITLLDGERLDGGILHRIAWDGRNSSGKTVISGVYYAVLKVNNEKFMIKIAVLR